MYAKNGLDTSGIVVAIVMVAAISLSIVGVCFFCCRELQDAEPPCQGCRSCRDCPRGQERCHGCFQATSNRKPACQAPTSTSSNLSWPREMRLALDRIPSRILTLL